MHVTEPNSTHTTHAWNTLMLQPDPALTRPTLLMWWATGTLRSPAHYTLSHFKMISLPQKNNPPFQGATFTLWWSHLKTPLSVAHPKERPPPRHVEGDMFNFLNLIRNNYQPIYTPTTRKRPLSNMFINDSFINDSFTTLQHKVTHAHAHTHLRKCLSRL